MFKTQNDEYQKIINFTPPEPKRKNTCFSYNSDRSDSSTEKKESLVSQPIVNPFKNLWIWIGINVISHTVNLVQSGLLLSAIAPRCEIIRHDPHDSNIVSLIFVIITMYMGYGATLWYILFVKILQVKMTGVDRTVLYSQEYKVEGNIELFVPSKG